MLDTAVGPSAMLPSAISPVPPAGEAMPAWSQDWEQPESVKDANKRIQIRLRTGFRPNCQTRASSCTPGDHKAVMVSNDLKAPDTSLRNWLP